jgi:hypothetical protein
MAVRMATMHRVTMISMRVKPPLFRAPTLEHFNTLAGSGSLMGKFALDTMQSRIKW